LFSVVSQNFDDGWHVSLVNQVAIVGIGPCIQTFPRGRTLGTDSLHSPPRRFPDLRFTDTSVSALSVAQRLVDAPNNQR